VAVVAFIARPPATGSAISNNALVGPQNSEMANPLDQLSSADIAVHVAKLTNLEETRSVASNADTVNAQLSITPADDKVVAKPQVVATAQKSRRDIKQYIVQPGDTVSSIATKFGITSDSIRWSNGLFGDTIAAGKELTIPPITGIVYVVKQGDTPDKLAARYRVSKEQIISFNDAEVAGLPVGQKIVIPDGTPPTNGFNVAAGGGFAWGGYAPIYGGNGYDYGYCTWWAAVRRSQVGKPIPSNLGNASTWKTLAQRAGLAVGNVPQQYAVLWEPPRNYYGHVGFVEEVYPDGSIKVSDMNYAGWGRVTYRTLTAAQAAAYSYIY
jgi:surface antigen